MEKSRVTCGFSTGGRGEVSAPNLQIVQGYVHSKEEDENEEVEEVKEEEKKKEKKKGIELSCQWEFEVQIWAWWFQSSFSDTEMTKKKTPFTFK